MHLPGYLCTFTIIYVFICLISSTQVFHEASLKFRGYADPRHSRSQSTDRYPFFAMPWTSQLIGDKSIETVTDSILSGRLRTHRPDTNLVSHHNSSNTKMKLFQTMIVITEQHLVISLIGHFRRHAHEGESLMWGLKKWDPSSKSSVAQTSSCLLVSFDWLSITITGKIFILF